MQIFGTILDQDTGSPLISAEVDLVPPAGQVPAWDAGQDVAGFQTVTNAFGQYYLSSGGYYPGSNWTLSISAPGYALTFVSDPQAKNGTNIYLKKSAGSGKIWPFIFLLPLLLLLKKKKR